jgi:hypothetical protein
MVLATNHILESSDKSDYDAKIVNAAWIAIPSFFKRIHFFYDISLVGVKVIFFSLLGMLYLPELVSTHRQHMENGAAYK